MFWVYLRRLCLLRVIFAKLEKFQAKIAGLINNKVKLETQLLNSKAETQRHKDELLTYKKKYAESDWEKEKLNHELITNKTNIEKLKKDKSHLQQEIVSLRKKMAESSNLATKSVTKEGDFAKLDVVQQEADELQERYGQALKEKEQLHEDIMTLQNRVSELQDEYSKNMDELQAQAQSANVKAYKAEIQLKNITRQKEALKKQLEDSQDEIKTYKDKNAILERDIVQLNQTLTSYEDDFAVKTRQIETLNEFNATLEKKIEVMRNELVSPQEVSMETFAAHEGFFDQQLLESSLQDMESALRSSTFAKDKLEGEVLFADNTIMELKDSNQRYQDDIKELQTKLSSAREKSSELESELFSRKTKLTNLDNECQELRMEVHDLLEKLEATKQQCMEMETIYEQVLTERDESKEKALFAERKVVEMKEIVRQDEDINNELEDKLASLKHHHLKMEGQSESNFKQIEHLKAELEAEKLSKVNSQQDLIALQNKLNETQRNLERNLREYELNKSANEEFKKSLKTKESKINTLNEENGKLQARLEVVEEEGRNLQEEALNSQNKVKALQQDNDLFTQERVRLETELHSAYTNISKLQSKLNVLEQDKHELDHQGLLHQEKLHKSDTELEETLKHNALLEAKVQDAMETLAKRYEEVNMLRNQLCEKQSLLDTCEHELNKKKMLVEQLREKIMKQSSYVESIYDEHERSKTLLESTQKDIMILRFQIELKTDELSRTKALNETSTKMKNQLENELGDTRKKLLAAEASSRKSSELNLRRELEVERARTADLLKKLQSYKSKMASLQSTSDSSKKDMLVVSEDLECAKEKIADLILDLDKSVDEKNDEIQKMYSFESKISDLEQDLSTANELNTKIDNELNEANMKVIKLESAVETLNKQRNNLKEKLDSANEKLLSQQEENMRLESKVNEQKKANDALNHVISRNDHVIGELREKVRVYDADTIKLRQDLRSLQIITDGLTTEKIGLEKRCTAYQQKIKGIETDLYKAREKRLSQEQELSLQKLKLNTNENQLGNLMKDKEHREKELENAQNNARKVKQELLQSQNKLHKLQRILETNAVELKQKENVNARLRDEKLSLETENISMKADIEGLKRGMKDGEDQITELENTLESSLCESVGTSLFELEEEDNELEVKALRAEELEKQAVEKEKSANEKLKEYKKKLSAKDSELNSAQQENAKVTEERNALERKYEQYKYVNDGLEAEKKGLKEQLMEANITTSELEVKYDFECKQRKSVEDQLSESFKKINKERAKMMKVEHENLEKQIAIEQAGKEIKDRDGDLDHMKESKCILEQQNEQLRDVLKEKNEEEEKRRSEYALLQDELLVLRSSISEHEAQTKRSQLEVQRTHENCQQHVIRITTLEEKIADLSSEKQHLDRTIECLKDSSENRLDMSNQSENKVRDIQREADRLTFEISRKDETEQNLKVRIKTMENELEISQQAAKKLKEDCKLLEKQKRNMEAEIKTLKEKKLIPKVVSTPVKGAVQEDMVTRKKLTDLLKNYEALQEKETELKEDLVASNAETSKLQNLYNTTSARKNELEESLSSRQKEYGSLKDAHTETLSKLEDTNLKLQQMVNKNNFLEEEITKATQSKLHLEKQLNDKEHELYILTNRSQSPRLVSPLTKTERFDAWPEKKKMEEDIDKLRKELRDLQVSLVKSSKARDEAESQIFQLKFKENETKVKLKCYQDENERFAAELQSYRCKSPSVDKERQKAILFERNSERYNSYDLQKLQKECEVLKSENEKLKVELSHLQAQKALMAIQESTNKNLEDNGKDLNVSESIGGEATREEEDFGVASLGKQYNTVIGEIMKLSRQLQEYKLDVCEWNANYNHITVSSERLQSTYHALQSLFDDLNASYEEQKDSIDVSEIIDLENSEELAELNSDDVDGAKYSFPSPPGKFSTVNKNGKETTETQDERDGHGNTKQNANKTASQQDSGFTSTKKTGNENDVMSPESHVEVEHEVSLEETPSDAFDSMRETEKKVGCHSTVAVAEEKKQRSGCEDGNDNASEVQSLKIRIAELESVIEKTTEEKDALIRDEEISVVPAETQQLQSSQDKELIFIENGKEHSEFSNEENVPFEREDETKNELVKEEKVKYMAAESSLQTDIQTDQNEQSKLDKQTTIPAGKQTKSTSRSTDEELSESYLKSMEDLQQENYELKLQLEILKKTGGDSNSLVAELRVMVARLRNELEMHKQDNIVGSRRRYTPEVNRSRDMNNNKPSTWNRPKSRSYNFSMTSDQESPSETYASKRNNSDQEHFKEHNKPAQSEEQDNKNSVNEGNIDDSSCQVSNNEPPTTWSNSKDDLSREKNNNQRENISSNSEDTIGEMSQQATTNRDQPASVSNSNVQLPQINVETIPTQGINVSQSENSVRGEHFFSDVLPPRNDNKSHVTSTEVTTPTHETHQGKDNVDEHSFSDIIPQATSSPTKHSMNDTGSNEDDSNASEDSSTDLAGLSSPDESSSLEGRHGRTSTSSTSPSGRTLHNSRPYTSAYNPYRSSGGYSSPYNMKNSMPFTRTTSFTKKYF